MDNGVHFASVITEPEVGAFFCSAVSTGNCRKNVSKDVAKKVLKN